MKSIHCILFLLFCCFILQTKCELPSGMVGEWQGSPNYSVLGPWGDYLFNFTISVVNGNSSIWLMEDFFSFPWIPNSEQEFWVEEGKGLTYCGILYHFFDAPPFIPAPIVVNFTQSFVKDNQVQWCYEDCSKVYWTLTLIDENTLNSQLFLASPVYHFNVTLTRVSTAKPQKLITLKNEGTNFSSYFPEYCNMTYVKPSPFEEYRKFHGDGVELTEKTFSLCPYARILNHLKADLNDKKNDEITETKEEEKFLADQYQYCYTLNPAALFNLSWNFHYESQTVDIRISMPLSSSELSSNPTSPIYLALGFQPDFPGMYNADIAMGYTTSSGDNCVRSMYVPYYVGTPVDDSSFQLTNQTVVQENGVLSVSFTRAFDTGHHNITVGPGRNTPAWTIMWASGPAPSDCSSSPSYHGNLRGVRAIDWAAPTHTFSPFMSCN